MEEKCCKKFEKNKNKDEPSVVAVQRDGNCFFTCIAVELFEDASMQQENNQGSSCGAKRCAACHHIIAAETFTRAEGKTFRVRNQLTCRSTIVVYAVYCKKCHKSLCVGNQRVHLQAPHTEPLRY